VLRCELRKEANFLSATNTPRLAPGRKQLLLQWVGISAALLTAAERPEREPKPSAPSSAISKMLICSYLHVMRITEHLRTDIGFHVLAAATISSANF
jgi:hypothetical protein